MAQEALTNVVKHSQGTTAGLQISLVEDETTFQVSDNGNGFDIPKSPTDFASNRHFGLLGIHERVNLIGARLELESIKAHGTRLTVQL